MTLDNAKAFIFLNDHWVALSAIESLYYDPVKHTINVRTVANTTFRVSAEHTDEHEAAEYARDWMLNLMTLVRNRRRGDKEDSTDLPALDSTF